MKISHLAFFHSISIESRGRECIVHLNSKIFGFARPIRDKNSEVARSREYYECDKALKPRDLRTPSVKLTVWGESLVRRRNDWKCNNALPESECEFPPYGRCLEGEEICIPNISGLEELVVAFFRLQAGSQRLNIVLSKVFDNLLIDLGERSYTPNINSPITVLSIEWSNTD